MAENHTPYTW